MHPNPDLLFQFGQALIAISREVYTQDGDQAQAGQVESIVTEILESHSSQPGFDLAIRQLLAQVKGLRASRDDKSKDGKPKLPLQDAIVRELGISLDVSGMNHMNLPINTWAEQDIDSSVNDALLDKQSMISPLMTLLFQTWSMDQSKHVYVLNWTECLKAQVKGENGVPPPLPDAFPQGLQIVSLTPLLKEGFLFFLVPLVRRLSAYRLRVFLRRRLRDEASNQSIAEGSQSFDFAYDLRIKVVAPAPEHKNSPPGSASDATAPAAPVAQGGGWLSSLLPQSGPLASFLDWANAPASDNSFVEKMEAETGHARRRSGSSGGTNSNSTGAVPNKSEAEHARDRAWSQHGSDRGSESSAGRSRVSSTDSSSGSLASASAASRAIQAELTQYEMDVHFDAVSDYSAPPILPRKSSAGNSLSSEVSSSYVAPSLTQSVPAASPIAPTASAKLSLVEAKLAKLRNSSEAKK